MSKIVSCITKAINQDEFWTKEHSNFDINTARTTMYDHLTKLRATEVNNAKDIVKNNVVELEVHKTDMYNIKKAIALGNDGQCCTALGAINAFSAPTYIMNKCIGAIELSDGGNFVGNTMIYLAYVDGKPSLVLDNIELKSKYQHNDKIRDTFMEYAKKLCDEIGCPDMPIYAGPNRHKLDMSIYPKETRSMQVIGSTGSDEIYLDYDAMPHVVNGQEKVNIEMYKIR